MQEKLVGVVRSLTSYINSHQKNGTSPMIVKLTENEDHPVEFIPNNDLNDSEHDEIATENDEFLGSNNQETIEDPQQKFGDTYYDENVPASSRSKVKPQFFIPS